MHAMDAVSVSAPRAVRPVAQLSATCWGTRGSIPSPGHATAHFGGNTSCLLVQAGERRLIFDAGTGIRGLGQQMLQRGGGRTEADLFLTHFHWDHIQGIPFFAPLYDPATDIRIHGSPQGDRDVESIFRAQLKPIYFPIPFEALEAGMTFRHIDEGPWQDGDVTVSAMRVRHPANTYGYRIDARGLSVAYIPDNELIGASYPVEDGWYDKLVEFLGGVDLLFHDAMFTDDEYPAHEGWGHSTFSQALDLARHAGVRSLRFFHHAPDRSDSELLDILTDLSQKLDASHSRLELGVAAEGEELPVQEQRP